MKNITRKIAALALATTFTAGLAAGCGSSDKAASAEPVKVAIPDDATNGGRAIKLLETAGLIEVDPSVGYVPELKDVTKYLYNIEIVPAQANTLPSTLDDYGAATINGTYALPAGLIPSKDALIVETQGEGGDNPYVNVIVARSADVDNETYKTVVDAYHTDLVANYIVGKYQEAYVPAFEYTAGDTAAAVEEVDAYKSEQGDKTVVKVGVCGSSNDYWNAVQKVLDEENANIYIERVEFDAYNLPNEALNSGEIDLNAFQHKAYLANEVESQGYEIEVIADTLMAPLSLYSHKFDSVDALKEAAGAKN